MIAQITDQSLYTSLWEANSLHILQHYNWGELKKSEGWDILRFIENEKQVIEFQVKKLPLLPYRFAYAPKIDPKGFELDLKQWEQVLKESNIALAIFEFKDTTSSTPFESLSVYNDHIQPQQSNTIDLTKSEEELWMGMEGNYRRNIKKAERQGVTITIHNRGNDAIKDFYSVMEDIFQNTKLLKRDRSYYVKLWDMFSPIDKATIFLAQKDDKLLGAYLLLSDANGCYELYGGVTQTGRSLEAGYILKWEAIKHMRSRSLKYYDHWGVAKLNSDGEYDPQDELYRISLFKKGFGGENIIFPPPRVLIVSDNGYKAFRMMNEVKKLGMAFRKLMKA